MEGVTSVRSVKCVLQRGGDKTHIYIVSGRSSGGIFSVKFQAPPRSRAKIPRVVRRAALYKSSGFPIGSPFVRLTGKSLGAFLGTVACPRGALCPMTDCGRHSFGGLVRMCLSTMFRPGVAGCGRVFVRRN